MSRLNYGLEFCKSENIINFYLEYFERFFASKGFVVHCANAGYVLIFFTSLIVSGQVFGADIEPELFHFDCERVDAGFKQPLEVNCGNILIEMNGGELCCKGSAEIVSCLTNSKCAICKQGRGIANSATDGDTNETKNNINNFGTHIAHWPWGWIVLLIALCILIALTFELRGW